MTVAYLTVDTVHRPDSAFQPSGPFAAFARLLSGFAKISAKKKEGCDVGVSTQTRPGLEEFS